MEKINAIEILLGAMGTDPEWNEALRIGVMAILRELTEQGAQPKKTAPKSTQKTKKKDSKDGNAKGRPKQVDVGQIKVLHQGGWSTAEIAGELKCSTQTVSKYLKEITANETNSN